MNSRGRPSFDKRKKELARQQRAREKSERKARRDAERSSRPDAPEGEDPDIAGIVPGPQPPPEEA